MGGKNDIAHAVNEAKHQQNRKRDLPQSLAEFT